MTDQPRLVLVDDLPTDATSCIIAGSPPAYSLPLIQERDILRIGDERVTVVDRQRLATDFGNYQLRITIERDLSVENRQPWPAGTEVEIVTHYAGDVSSAPPNPEGTGFKLTDFESDEVRTVSAEQLAAAMTRDELARTRGTNGNGTPSPTIVDSDRLIRSLTNITPSAEQIEIIEHFRFLAKTFGLQVIANAPAGHERALAITKLEETVMWAVKAVLI